jgi:hypothetical protein
MEPGEDRYRSSPVFIVARPAFAARLSVTKKKTFPFLQGSFSSSIPSSGILDQRNALGNGTTTKEEPTMAVSARPDSIARRLLPILG